MESKIVKNSRLQIRRLQYKDKMRRLTFPLILILLAYSPAASAHPHAWISVRTTIFLNDKGEATAIREHWLFDKMYSVYASKDFNPNKNGKFTAKDLLPLAQQNISNLKDYNYFTVFEGNDGKSVTFKEAKDIASSFEIAPPNEKKKVIIYALPRGQVANDTLPSGIKQIAMDFTVPLATPINLRPGKAVYRIYDPTYYTDIDHFEQNPVTFVNEKDGKEITTCKSKVELPKVDQGMLFSAASLDKKDNAAPKDLGYYFSEKVTLSCSQQQKP
jgi:ABC-type uncharacterized transport system substrate-binding protein